MIIIVLTKTPLVAARTDHAACSPCSQTAIAPTNLQYATADNYEPHSALKSFGTSPNFLITVASLKSPVAGSPVRENATAPTLPCLRESAWARITAALGLKHSTGSPAAMPSSVANERK